MDYSETQARFMQQVDNSELTERQLVDRAIAALTEIENRMRKSQPGLRLEIIDLVLQFARQFPVEDGPQRRGPETKTLHQTKPVEREGGL